MPTMIQKKVWLITGASSGLGSAIALAALKAGHKVIAAARNPAKAAAANPEITALGAQWLKLDVTSKDAQQIVSKTIQKAGRIDVVVNNAGYITIAALEDLSDEEIQEQMDTNFYGTLRVTRAAVPFMRAQSSGTIVNISSVFGYCPQAGAAMYTASKHAVEGLTSALALELAPFNIRFVLVEPGMFRTNVCRDRRIPATPLSQPYEGTPVQQAQALSEHCVKVPERMAGNPAKLGARVLEFVDGNGMCGALKEKGYLRLPLGKDGMFLWKKQLKELQENVAAMEEIAASTGYDA